MYEIIKRHLNEMKFSVPNLKVKIKNVYLVHLKSSGIFLKIFHGETRNGLTSLTRNHYLLFLHLYSTIIN